MYAVRMLKGDMTFNELADQLLAMILGMAGLCKRVDIVFDVYQSTSIKESERLARGSDDGIRFTSICGGHKIKHWRRLLSNGSSKMKLIEFLVEKWTTPSARQALGERTLYLTCREKCMRITFQKVSDAPEFFCSQEEAGGRLLLHAKHAAS